ncbi:MAG: response regulator transcription factor [Deltaproteobacteria bacterium]|nr:response regulator transcription factor [Deltaproteobacteria bacterium]
MAEILSQPEVLIVTGDFELSQVLRLILHERGYQIYLAPGVATATEELGNYLFDLVIFQWSGDLPETLNLVARAKQGVRPAKVMALSGRGQVWPAAAFEAEIDDYLTFPFSTGELSRRVAALLKPASPDSSRMDASPAEQINARVLEPLHLLMAQIRSPMVKAGAFLNAAGAQASEPLQAKGPNPRRRRCRSWPKPSP